MERCSRALGNAILSGLLGYIIFSAALTLIWMGVVAITEPTQFFSGIENPLKNAPSIVMALLLAFSLISIVSCATFGYWKEWHRG